MQKNISDYGGDKDNVTIFGESAGGWSVEALLSSDKTVGYFHKAIAQSGCLYCPAGYLENEDQYNALMEFARDHLNLERVDEIQDAFRALSIDEIKAFYKATPAFLGGFTGIYEYKLCTNFLSYYCYKVAHVQTTSFSVHSKNKCHCQIRFHL